MPQSDDVIGGINEGPEENENSQEVIPDYSPNNFNETENIQVPVGSFEIYEVSIDGTLKNPAGSYSDNHEQGLQTQVEKEVASIEIVEYYEDERQAGEEDKNIQEERQAEDENIQSEIGVKMVEKKVRKRKPEISKWEMNENKGKRMKGKEYKGLTKNNGKWIYNQPRKARQMKPFCNCKHSANDTRIKCNLFTEEERLNIFQGFWQDLTWEQRKIYINSLFDTATPKDKKNIKNTVSRRNVTLLYHLKKQGIRVRVCKKMFINTLDIGEWSSHSWALLNNLENNNSNITADNDPVSDKLEVVTRKSHKISERL